jgi:hypothetical protein
MADHRVEDPFGGAVGPAQPTNPSETQPSKSAPALRGEAPPNVDLRRSTTDWDAIDPFLNEWAALASFPPEGDAASEKT